MFTGLLCRLCFFALFLLVATPLRAADYLWLEGERPTTINVKPAEGGIEHAEHLSEGRWLLVKFEPGDVDKSMPSGGVLIAYSFKTAEANEYEIWDRIGFEFVRSPFDWRVDGGAWKTVSPEELTSDLVQLGFFTEAAWLKLGKQPLAAGDHQLEIRLTKTQDDKGKTARVLYASDALCLAPIFLPNGKYKPDQDWRSARDREAENVQFTVPADAGAARTTLSLKGLWRICRDDENEPRDVATPIAALPAHPFWKSIEVPGDRNTLRQDLIFAHRFWYRTKINVPAAQKGRSFYLVFPQNNLNTTVYVNGMLCGFDKNPFARVQIDISKAIKPGINELWVGIRDAWYAFAESPSDTRVLRKRWNLPERFFGSGFQNLVYPIWQGSMSGILDEPSLVVAGPVYAADVFVKPSVVKKELAAEVTLTNPFATPATGEIAWEVINVKTGASEKTFATQPFTVAASKSETFQLVDKWDTANLWWPDTPNLYYLRTTLKVGGRPVDIADTRFGFREWTIDGIDFRLNGIKWPLWATLPEVSDKDKFIQWYRATNQRTYRLTGHAQGGFRTFGMQPNQTLDFLDENGVTVRRCGPLDGEAIGYMAIQTDNELKRRDGTEINLPLLNNWRDQMVAQVRGERNHPSIQSWSIENEFLYINCINLYGNLMDKFEAEAKKVSDAVMAVDPTRSTMTDGGGANKDQSMPVHCNHYVGPDFTSYPQLAYEPNSAGGSRDRWYWDLKHPRFLGEDYFATGINPADYSAIGGEEAFLGKAQARPAAGLTANLMSQGYRWANFAAFHFWLGESAAANYWPSFAPVAVFCKEWDWTFESGASVKRTMRVFNSTHAADPITFTWTLHVEGKKASGESKVFNVPPGESQSFDLTLALPAVAGRAEGELVLTLTRGGAEVYRDTKAVSVLNTGGKATGPAAKIGPKAFLVFDPHGIVAPFLTARGLIFTKIDSLAVLPATPAVLIVGKDALDTAESTSTRLAAYALSGSRVIVLEQRNPLKFQAIPADVEAARNLGSFAFAEDLNHPVMQGLRQKDFFTWSGNGYSYLNAYRKPVSGAKSLVQCDARLGNSALVEVPTDRGLLLLSQLLVGEKLAESPAARQLLLNLIDYAASYRQEFLPVVGVTKTSPLLTRTLTDIGLKFTEAVSPAAALSAKDAKIAIIDATPENLKTLATSLSAVNAFTQAGGWIVLNGLTPDGLADYNKLVGFEHMIRPFRRERVSLASPRHPLTSGLTLGDVVMLSSERIASFTADVFVADDEFSYVVDYEDVAPFAKFPDDFALNTVNGFVNADSWKYIYNVPAPAAPPLDLAFTLPKEQEIKSLQWIGNTNYYPVTKVQLLADGKESAVLDTQGSNAPHDFDLDPRLRGTRIALRLAAWDKPPGVKAVTGLDNFSLLAVRPSDFHDRVKPMLNIGGMMAYPRGTGGIVLCNLLFKDNEAVPINASKKRTILATILRNLKAPLGGGKTIIAGAKLRYTPIDLSRQANAFRNEQGWFGDKNYTFKDLPLGAQTFASVNYNVYEFPTSPVPTVVMLGGNGVPGGLADKVTGIPVNQKADALFFLQAARVDRRRSPDDIKKGVRFELARYVVHYANGKSENVPVYSEINVDHYKQKTPPVALPGAQLAWSKPYDKPDQSAAAYSMQWTNPHPETVITTVDLVYGEQKVGVPALLALTAATQP